MLRQLINGKADAFIPFSDRGLHYADGVFETVALRNGCLQFWQQHLDRMQHACRRLGLPQVDAAQWLQDVRALQLDANQDAVIKLMLTRGSGGRGYGPPADAQATRMVAAYAFPVHADTLRQQGVTLRMCRTPVSINSALAGIKHLSRLENVLARAEWQDEHIHEGLMCDDLGHVIEGTMSNVFMVQNNALYTPAVKKSGVDGIIRNRIIELAKRAGLVVQQVAVSAKQLPAMDEIFVTNSVIGVWPVINLDGKIYERGPVTAALIEQLDMEQGALRVQTD